MARVTKKEVLAERQDIQQPGLLDDSQFPVCLPVLEAVRHRRYEHVGARLTEDDGRCLRLVELLMARWGVKRISREMNISPHTVRAARRVLTQQGKMAPYVQRVVETMEDAIEAGMCNYRDALEEGRISPTQIPVGIGIIFDKRQLATNQATSISAAAGTVGEDLTVEKLNAFLERLPVANATNEGTKDSPSTGTMRKGQQTEGNPPQDATLDATGPGPRPDGRTEAGQPDAGAAVGMGTGRTDAGPDADAAGRGAGGGPRGGAADSPDALG
jgi:predicted transcriptional regulator